MARPTIKALQEKITALSTIISRSSLAQRLGQQFGGKRDVYEVLGYKKDLRFEDYEAKYDRQDIAARIVDAPAQATWRDFPEVKEDKEGDETEFEKTWKALQKKLKVHHYLERIDRLSGIGCYGVLLVGTTGDTPLKEPLKKGSLKSPDEIIYLKAFSEKFAKISTFVTDTNSPNFGKPLLYDIDIEMGDKGSVSRQVHSSRVIHVAENMLKNEVYGTPRLKNVFNLMDDLMKLVGASAEMFWLGANRGLHADVKDGFGLEGDELTNLSDEIDEYVHNLRRFIRTKGVDIKPLGGQTADPKGSFETIISLISGTTSIPKRILLGSERGELASSQDETNWNKYVSSRQTSFAEPQILRALIDRFTWLGVLKEPSEGYTVVWPDLFAKSDEERGKVASLVANAISKLQTEEGKPVITVAEFRERYLGLPPEPPKESTNK